MATHYAAYHNVDRMGRALHDDDPCRVISNKPLDRLQGSVVWMIVGESVGGARRKRFTLGSVFHVSETGGQDGGDFRHFAAGPGHAFDPPPVLNEEPWFDEFRRKCRSFEGIRPIIEFHHLQGLKQVAASHGCVIE
ncbi:MAG: hypothetical protein IT424_01945 [Pirellulales bacterium]|nr:hypothetical protein [Pirellulales bacterium]